MTESSGYLWRRTMRFMKWFLALTASYLILLSIMHYNSDAALSNGAVLKRNFDLRKGSRVDLYSARTGEVIVKDVDLICWNDAALEGNGASDRFIWFVDDHEVILRSDPRFYDAYAKSGLRKPGGGCSGYYEAYLDPELLIDRRYAARP